MTAKRNTKPVSSGVQVADMSVQDRKYLPRVFTEHGALMAVNVLNSKRAVLQEGLNS